MVLPYVIECLLQCASAHTTEAHFSDITACTEHTCLRMKYLKAIQNSAEMEFSEEMDLEM